MPNSDFGLVRDPIQSVTQVSPTIAGGQTTYRMTFFSGKTFDFNVYNGANGYGQIKTQTFQNITSSSSFTDVKTWVTDNYDNILTGYLVKYDNTRNRLFFGFNDYDNDNPFIYVYNGETSDTAPKMNDLRKLSNRDFQTASSSYYNSTIVILYLDTTIQPPTYPTLAVDPNPVNYSHAVRLSWKGNWMLSSCLLQFKDKTTHQLVCGIIVEWDNKSGSAGWEGSYVCSNRTFGTDLDDIAYAEVTYGNEYTSEQELVVDTAGTGQSFVYDSTLYDVEASYAYYCRMDAGFVWQR